MTQQESSEGNAFTEKIEVAANEIVDTIKKLFKDGSVRRIVIRNDEGKELLAVPMNAGVIGGGVVVLAAPLIAAIAAITALAKKVTLEVERTDASDEGEGIVDAEVVDEHPEGEASAE